MPKVVQKIPYLNKLMTRNASKGQSLVEFAMISILLFFLLFGIIEMARLMFIWTQVTSAAEEGVRYGSTHPGEIIDPCCRGGYPIGSTNPDPCNIVAQARARVTLVYTGDVSVVVGYDDGEGDNPQPVYPFASSPPSFQPAVYRVVVTSTYQFHFLVPLVDGVFPPSGLPVSMVAARTISRDEPQPWPTTCSDNPPQ